MPGIASAPMPTSQPRTPPVMPPRKAPVPAPSAPMPVFSTIVRVSRLSRATTET